MTDFVRIHEVGPRDGLQNEPGVIDVVKKIALIDTLSQSGLSHIEVGSFVSPKWVPQMAESDRVLAGITPQPAVHYAVLVPNMRGWEAFAAARVAGVAYEVAVFISASEGFSRNNLNCSVAESITRLRPVVRAAQEADVPLRGYVSCVTDCPFDGPTRPAQVTAAVGMLRDVAPIPISLGDTIGKATPDTIVTLLEDVTTVVPATQLAGHFHDTGGRALQNIEAALDYGLRDFDSAVGGLGGCPYAPGAPGNVATEAVIAMMDRLGYQTGINADVVARAADMAKGLR